ncbi:MAG TPA: response regulator [Verrucomicrobiae bacterium]|nr:response regulator [Verrucomicrobiae bacterium]
MPHLLLIEDNQHIQRIFRERLQREGFQVATADDGEQGLQRARDLRPDIILLDIMLPKMDGLEVLKHLREDAALANIPVFMLSNRSTSNDIQHARTLGARRFFAKGTSALHDVMWHIRHECDFKKVLVCAPNAEAAAPIVGALEHPQVLCSVVTVFADAIGTASRGSPDLVVLDARPPAANACTALQQLKSSAATKSLTVVAVGVDEPATHRADALVDGARLATDLRPIVMKSLGVEPAEVPALAAVSG